VLNPLEVKDMKEVEVEDWVEIKRVEEKQIWAITIVMLEDVILVID
jgi:hypothetical protein